MPFFTTIREKLPKLFKVLGVTVGVIVVLFILLSFGNAFFRATMRTGQGGGLSPQLIPGVNMAGEFDGSGPAYRGSGSVTNKVALFESSSNDSDSPIDTASESFEVTQYTIRYEKQSGGETCAAIADLKKHEYVIFEQSSVSDRSCSFTFKVARQNAKEVLGLLNQLDPKDMSESTQTIKRTLEGLSNESDILLLKQKRIESTLNEAIAQYDAIIRTATNASDIQALAQVVDSKLVIIQKLSQENINIVNQLNNIERARNEQLDRVRYVYFSVSVNDNRYIDKDALGDSWKNATKRFVGDVNRVIQAATIDLVRVAFNVALYVLYILLLTVVARFVFHWVKVIWNRGRKELNDTIPTS